MNPDLNPQAGAAQRNEVVCAEYDIARYVPDPPEGEARLWYPTFPAHARAG